MQRGDIANVYFPFIEVKLKDGTSLSWNGNAPDYFTSLTHKRIVGEANNTTISISVAIGPNDDPDKIERVIVESGGECTFQYGYAGRKSYIYKGLILGYTPSFSEGVISYTLNIISKAVIYNGIKMTGVKYNVPNDPTINTGHSAIDTLYSAAANIAGHGAVINAMEEIVDRYMPGYTFDEANSDVDFSIPAIDVDCEGLSPVEAMQGIADLLYYGNDEDRSLYRYKIIVDDSVGSSELGGTVKLKKQGCKYDQKADKTYEFVWGSKDCDVLSWSPQYNGEVLIFCDTKNTAEITATVQYDTQSVENAAFQQPPIAGYIDNHDKWKGNWNEVKTYRQTLEDTGWFCEHCNYPYKAEITVLGVPDADLELLSFVNVIPMVGGGKAHHSKGVYQVLGIVDTVNSSGYTTKLSLIRSVEMSKLYIADQHQYVFDKNGNKVNLFEYVPNYSKGTPNQANMSYDTATVASVNVISGTGSNATVIPSGTYKNATIVWNALAKAGYSDILCAGILGNLMVESSSYDENYRPTLNINPSLVGDGGEAWGVAQWHKWASEVWGNPDINAQADFLVKTIKSEILQQEKGEQKLSNFLNSTTPEEAAMYFNMYYERSADSYPYMKRQLAARDAYEWYSSLAQNGSSSKRSSSPDAVTRETK